MPCRPTRTTSTTNSDFKIHTPTHTGTLATVVTHLLPHQTKKNVILTCSKRARCTCMSCASLTLPCSVNVFKTLASILILSFLGSVPLRPALLSSLLMSPTVLCQISLCHLTSRAGNGPQSNCPRTQRTWTRTPSRKDHSTPANLTLRSPKIPEARTTPGEARGSELMLSSRLLELRSNLLSLPQAPFPWDPSTAPCWTTGHVTCSVLRNGHPALRLQSSRPYSCN